MLVWQNENYRIFKLSCLSYNCYILNCGERNILIDTGIKFIRKALMKRLKKLNIKSISAVVLTHFHSDHVGNAAYIADKFNCPVYASPVFAEWLRKGECVMPHSNSLSSSIVNSLSRGFGFIHLDCFDPIPNIRDVDELLASGMLGDGVRKISLTAHTDDSICILVDNEAAIVGDAFVNYPVVNKITLPWADHPEQIADSWRELLDLNCGIYCPGHGTPAKRKALEKAVKF
ncbi:MAG: MBL fold metallo-hydrolase [Firmicutes bacterium]|nr:MBL fold metallo-hydrolase [Bacillota bacterium]